LNGRGTCAVGATLPANGGTYTCTFPGDFTGVPNASQTDVVTVVAVDNEGTTATDNDDAVVTLTGGPVTITTVASAGRVGAEVFDTATLTGGFNPTGTVTFRLFGPNDDDCSGPAIFTNVKPVPADGSPKVVVSDRFVLPDPGVYHWVATYSGDANNAPAGPTPCDDPNETVGANRLAISLATVASPSVVVGNPIFDTATVAGGFNPTGTLTFRLYGPDNPTCAGTPIFTSVKQVSGNAQYTSDSFIPTHPGEYRWVAEYSGDGRHSPAITPCEDPMERVTVTPLPQIQVEKSATPASRPAPGGTFTFNVVVTNTSNVRLTIRTLTDDVYGDITTRP
ncbi:MAG: hypothetical protein LC708_04450, partial [Actinobacteria bacterium]|nr:hypothetical protein [Actinomycetota bacterium]